MRSPNKGSCSVVGAAPFFVAAVYVYVPLCSAWPPAGDRVPPAAFCDVEPAGAAAAAGAGAAWAAGVLLVLLATPELTLTVAFAIARCYPLVTAAAGVVAFGEAADASHRTKAWLAAEFALYASGVALICASKHVAWAP